MRKEGIVETYSPTVATSGRGRIRTIRANHVVNGGHVDGIVGDTDNGGKDHGANPVDRRSLDGPCKANETNRQARRRVE